MARLLDASESSFNQLGDRVGDDLRLHDSIAVSGKEVPLRASSTIDLKKMIVTPLLSYDQHAFRITFRDTFVHRKASGMARTKLR